MTTMMIKMMMIMQRGKMTTGHVMTGEALKKLQQQMKVNREERRLTVRRFRSLVSRLCTCESLSAISLLAISDTKTVDNNNNNKLNFKYFKN